MYIDFHSHVKLSKKSTFETSFVLEGARYAKETGLNSYVMSEHFNTLDFYKIYAEMDKAFTYQEDYYSVEGIKIFPGLEVDVAGGGHIILVAPKENLLRIRRALDKHEKKDNFISLEGLLDLGEAENALMIGAHPFREPHLLCNQPKELLRRLHAFDLNATDIYKYGQEEITRRVEALAEELGIRVVSGSDTHYPIQFGSVRTRLNRTCETIEELKQIVVQGDYSIHISEVLELRVFAAKCTKEFLKEQLNS